VDGGEWNGLGWVAVGGAVDEVDIPSGDIGEGGMIRGLPNGAPETEVIVSPLSFLIEPGWDCQGELDPEGGEVGEIASVFAR